MRLAKIIKIQINNYLVKFNYFFSKKCILDGFDFKLDYNKTSHR
jgi:hypothetical protein